MWLNHHCQLLLCQQMKTFLYYGRIARTPLKSLLSWVPLNWVKIWVADFATQHLSVLVLIWEWVLCSGNNFHATSYLSRLTHWVMFLQSALSPLDKILACLLEHADLIWLKSIFWIESKNHWFSVNQIFICESEYSKLHGSICHTFDQVNLFVVMPYISSWLLLLSCLCSCFKCGAQHWSFLCVGCFHF